VRARRTIFCRTRRRGVVTPWVLLSLTVIIGIVAFGLDGGRMLQERRRIQATADAAALAGAAQLYQNYRLWQGKDPEAKAKDAALSIAAANGAANDGAASVVTVNIPPKSGAFAGKDAYVEVIVQSKLQASFGRIFTGSDVTVQARAVARGRPAKIGVVTLSPSGAGALTTTGNGILAVVNAAITVNSTDPVALKVDSNGALIAEAIDIAGNYQISGNGLIVGPIHTGVEPSADPLATLPVPDLAAYPVQSFSTLEINDKVTILNPGVYKGGINIGGNSSVTMKPGVYILDGGGLQIGGNATLTAIEVMIYNASVSAPAGQFRLSGNGKLTLVPPLSGTYQGIALFQQRDLADSIAVNGNGAAAVMGVLYAPAAAVNITGNAALGADVLGGGIIADTLRVSGNGSINIATASEHEFQGQEYGINIDLRANYPNVPDITLVE